MTTHNREWSRVSWSWKLIPGTSSFNIHESKIIEEEHSEYDQGINSPMPRLEENKSSDDEQDFEDLNWFEINDSEDGLSPTPRFDNHTVELTIMNWNQEEESIQKEIKVKKSKCLILSKKQIIGILHNILW